MENSVEPMEIGLVDKRSILQVIGGLLQNHMLIDDIDRQLDRTDFYAGELKLYEIIYAAIYNLYMQGLENIDEFAIDSYLATYKQQYQLFCENNGLQYIQDAKDMADLGNYDYYYHRLRKFSLLRYYENNGLDTRGIYDSTVADMKEAEAEQKKFDKYTEQDIVDIIENALVVSPKMNYCSNTLSQDIQAGDGLHELVNSLLEEPDFGYNFTSPALNTICRGARRGKFYLRSAATGTGKTRNFLMDCCNFSVPYTYDVEKKEYVYTGQSVPTLFVGTEGSLQEFQTIVLACVSGVEESHIRKGEYEKDELDRVRQAEKYINEAPLYLVYCDDYSITDVENMAKKYVLTRNIEIFVFDYLQTSLRLMSEISGNAKIKMQEYQLLTIFSTRMKALAERLDICIISGTQLSAEANDARYKTNLVLQGSKSVAQKVDIGVIISKPNPAEKKKIETLTRKMLNIPDINLLTWCYKVRAGELSSVIVCSHIDLGNMRIKDCFVCDFDFNLLDVDFTQIKVIDKALKDNSVDFIEAEETLSSQVETYDDYEEEIEDDSDEESEEVESTIKQPFVF